MDDIDILLKREREQVPLLQAAQRRFDHAKETDERLTVQLEDAQKGLRELQLRTADLADAAKRRHEMFERLLATGEPPPRVPLVVICGRVCLTAHALFC